MACSRVLENKSNCLEAQAPADDWCASCMEHLTVPTQHRCGDCGRLDGEGHDATCTVQVQDEL